MSEIATDAELREVAKQIKTRGIPKALRALAATRKHHWVLICHAPNNDPCPLCKIYRPSAPSACGVCPGATDVGQNPASARLCDIVSGNPHAEVAKLCTRLMCFIRAEQKMRGH